MANEITVSVTLKATKGGSSPLWVENNLSFTWTGNNFLRHRQTIGTSEEVITLGDAGVGGLCMCKNHDSTNPVDIRPDTGLTNMITIKAGDVALFRIASGATPYAIATGGNVEVEFLILEA